MYIQPNSKEIRKYIPQQEYFELMAQQKRRSYVGLSLRNCAHEEIKKRIDELKELEKIGFVFFGEKNWLQNYYKDGKITVENYSSWVLDNFSNYLKIEFTIAENYPLNKDGVVWTADLNTENLLLDFKELNNPFFEKLDELEIFIAGSEHAPSSIHLVQAFEFLHNFEYALHTFPHGDKGRAPLGITGIDVTNMEDPRRWELNVISEYGAERDMSVIGGFAWRIKYL